jgi:hypothetical protein
MLEALLVPVVKKAVDFLFDEGHDVLKAYRERNKLPVAANDKAQDNEVVPLLRLSKDDALKRKIDDSLVDRYRSELTHLLQLQEIQTRNYHAAKEQEAVWTKELVPAIVVNRIIIAEKDLADTTERLAVILQKLYGDTSTK